MGAMLCTEDAALAFTPGMHGTTFGGGPLACAVAIAVLDTINNENLLNHVRDTGNYFKTQLQALADRYDDVVDVRGMGLMLGMELCSSDLAEKVTKLMMERRIILNRTSETVLRFLPPYILQREHVEITVAALDEILMANEAYASTLPAGEHING